MPDSSCSLRGDSSVDAMLCRWAEKKYDLHEVVSVDFEFADDGDYSELTPGDGPYMRVLIRHRTAKSGTQSYLRKDATYDTALIREILAFAVEAH